MRKLWLALAPALVVLAAPAIATGTEPAVRAKASSFQLFGTSFCYVSKGAPCDVTLAAETVSLTKGVMADGPRGGSIQVLGLRLCASPHKLGPACDAAWVLPAATQAWRDQPEIRLAADLDR